MVPPAELGLKATLHYVSQTPPRLSVPIYIYIYIYIEYIYIYIYTHTHTHTRLYTHTHTQNRFSIRFARSRQKVVWVSGNAAMADAAMADTISTSEWRGGGKGRAPWPVENDVQARVGHTLVKVCCLSAPDRFDLCQNATNRATLTVSIGSVRLSIE